MTSELQPLKPQQQSLSQPLSQLEQPSQVRSASHNHCYSHWRACANRHSLTTPTSTLQPALDNIVAQPEAALYGLEGEPGAYFAWQASIAVPRGPFAGGVFLADIVFPQDFQLAAPEVVFRTIPFHPAVDADAGLVAAAALDWEWARSDAGTAAHDAGASPCDAADAAGPVRRVLLALQRLLCEPGMEHCPDPEACVLNAAALEAYKADCDGGGGGEGGHGLFHARARDCVEATLRVQAGHTPHEGIDPNPNPFDVALASLPRAALLSEEEQRQLREARRAAHASIPPAISFSEYRRDWQQMGIATDNTVPAVGKPRSELPRPQSSSSVGSATSSLTASPSPPRSAATGGRQSSARGAAAERLQSGGGQAGRERQGSARSVRSARSARSIQSARSAARTGSGRAAEQEEMTVVVRQGDVETRRSSAQLHAAGGAEHEGDEEALLAWTEGLNLSDVDDDSDSGSDVSAAAEA